jgi:NAD(P)-dependent dehydrogenase (short-subunit alcohol dehydrogenase family)
MSLSNKTAIVTGGTGALGSVVVEKFFEAGMNIAIPYHSLDSITGLPRKMREAANHLLMMQTDLAEDDQVREFVEHVVRKFNRVHVLVNIAGGYSGGRRIADTSPDEWDSMMTKNLKTAFLMSREILKPMLAQRFGRIVSIAAMPALTSGANKGAYAISKRGVIALMETIADEVKESGVTANAIAPSIILTEANKASMPNTEFAKWVTPAEIAELIMFLCSESARSINGNVIKIFGGV